MVIISSEYTNPDLEVNAQLFFCARISFHLHYFHLPLLCILKPWFRSVTELCPRSTALDINLLCFLFVSMSCLLSFSRTLLILESFQNMRSFRIGKRGAFILFFLPECNFYYGSLKHTLELFPSRKAEMIFRKDPCLYIWYNFVRRNRLYQWSICIIVDCEFGTP